MENWKEIVETASWVGRQLFERGKTSGSSANLSFWWDEHLYITRSGSCFGALDEHSFACVDKNGLVLGEAKPSKELPLHQILYQAHPEVQAILHVHSPYCVLWSSLPDLNSRDAVPAYTPYLRMKLGAVSLVPYATPGSQQLFDAFRHCGTAGCGSLLAQHGPVVGGKNLMDAFYALEELEESCRIAWEVRVSGLPIRTID